MSTEETPTAPSGSFGPDVGKKGFKKAPKPKKAGDVEASQVDSIKALIAALSVDYETYIRNVAIALAYQAWDPLAARILIINAFMRYGKDKPSEVERLLINGLVATQCCGSRIKEFSKLTKDGQKVAAELAKAGVNLNPRPGSQPNATITLGRIAAAFPKEDAIIRGKGLTRIVGEAPAGYPLSLCGPGSVAMFPKAVFENQAHPLLKGYMTWRESFDVTINRTTRDGAEIDKEKAKSRSKQFMRVAFDSRIIPQDDRLVLLAGVLGRERLVRFRSNLEGLQLFDAHCGDLLPVVIQSQENYVFDQEQLQSDEAGFMSQVPRGKLYARRSKRNAEEDESDESGSEAGSDEEGGDESGASEAEDEGGSKKKGGGASPAAAPRQHRQGGGAGAKPAPSASSSKPAAPSASPQPRGTALPK